MNQPTTHQASASPQSGPEKLPGIRHIVAIGSGKGGVGKSTVSVNLALVLRQLGGRIGLVDADVLGPSIPGMLGIPTNRPPAATPDGKAIPTERYGVKTISMGMFTGEDTPAVLRGPMVGKYLRMLIGGVQWGDARLLDSGSASRHRRHAADTGAEPDVVRRRDRHDTAGCQPENRPPRPADVREGACPHTRDRREHELFHLPPLRPEHRYLPSRRR